MLHQLIFLMLSQTFKNIAKLFTTTEILHAFLSNVHPSFRFSLERGNFSDIGDASREFSRDLTHGSSFSLRYFLRKSPLLQNITRRYYFASVTLMCLHRHEKVYVSRRIIFARRLVRQVSAGL